MNPNERTLELDKILELLANEAANDLTPPTATDGFSCSTSRAGENRLCPCLGSAVRHTALLCLSGYVHVPTACQIRSKALPQRPAGNRTHSATGTGIE